MAKSDDSTPDAPQYEESDQRKGADIPEADAKSTDLTDTPPNDPEVNDASDVSDDIPETEDTGALADAAVGDPTPVTPEVSANKDAGPTPDDFERIVPSTDGPPPAEETTS